MTERRKKAIIRRRIFIGICIMVIVLVVAAVSTIIALIKNASTDKNLVSSQPSTSSAEIDAFVSDVPANSQPEIDSEPEYVSRGEYTLDADYSRLLLVNGKNPLPDDYNYGANLITIEKKYLNGFRNQINADIWPYMKAMVEAAWADGVDLYILSPYRSYEAQNTLFKNKVAQVGSEDVAATIVARPGTSEHNTGLCADFNMANSDFEKTEMYTWLCENAEDYGFILRYPENKIDITGVIYESWHWRFVGINVAKEMNSLGYTLEEYIEYKNIDPSAELNSN